ncbi:MAG: ParB/RepB/Spo0J family partition protein [Erysipelotrichia bacterium]|nr:ParB/RepB/Spo0J family partition protein [Erysipelotrichia bacterium]NCC55157.1 ParB/RepB/Spo0J family partition protein [Erysipelotrichia bacterium]
MKELKLIEVSKVMPNPYQPRNYFDEKGIDELAKSIKENGLIQPISVRDKNGMYEIVVGERRFRALQKLGYTEIEAYVLDDNEAGSMNKALIENIQRENLSAIEEAKAYLKIMQYQLITQSELAEQIGKSQPSIANKIRLLNLNDNIQNAVESKMISERHARAMLSLSSEEQNKVLDSIIKEGLNVEQTEKKVQTLKPKKKKQTKGYSRNVQVAINTIKQAVAMVERTGINVDFKTSDDEDYVNIQLKIKK